MKPDFLTCGGGLPSYLACAMLFGAILLSAGAGLAGNSADSLYVARATEAARGFVAQTGRYSLVETSGVEDASAREHALRKCNGCEAAIAAKLGADQR